MVTRSHDMWVEKNNGLEVSLVFKDFREAFGFMQQVADLAEAHGHHPEWFNVYNRLDIRLSTHDAGNIVTEKDRELATAISQLPGFSGALQ
ncbi:MAG: 4a-hydroxytetrahydrobiopterin dehydratase [Pseudomonadales bacterium]